MKARLKIERQYNITLNSVEYKNCRLITRWEGMAKFITANDIHLILKVDDVLMYLNDISGDQLSCEVITCPPGLISDIKEKTNAG